MPEPHPSRISPRSLPHLPEDRDVPYTFESALKLYITITVHGAAHEGEPTHRKYAFKTDGFVEGVLSKCLCVSRYRFPSSFFL